MGYGIAWLFVVVFDAFVVAALMTVATYLYVLYRSVIDARAV